MKRIIIPIVFILIIVSSSSCSNKHAESIVLSPTTTEIPIETSAQLSYTVLPDDAMDTKVTWKSIDQSIASVDSAGVVTGVSIGTTDIIVYCDNDIYAKCSVTVCDKPAYDKLTENDRNLVDAFMLGIDKFSDKEPLYITFASYIESGNYWDLSIRSENVFGGQSEKDYILDLDGKISSCPIPLFPYETECNLEIINQAIQELLKG